MKNTFLVLVLALVTTSAFSQFNKSKLRAGGGLVFATDIGNIGINLNAAYHVKDEWEGAFAYNHIFKKDNTTFNIFDFDGHYIFYKENSGMNFYAIGGLAITSIKSSYRVYSNSYFNGTEYSNSEANIGLNAGVGMNYKISNDLNLAPEFRLTLTDRVYARIGASVQYLF